ncbi:MAG: GNAT family N-acetyltransferase [Kiloniellaceae bacterium]
MTTTDMPPSPTAPQDLSIVPFEPAHLHGALRLSQEAGWPHQSEDWALGLSVSQGVVALDGETVVGTALCAPFGRVALLNMIIVNARMRGRGLGRRLMTAVMALAGDRDMRLVATAEGIPLYENLGFVTTGRILQHQGIAIAGTPELPVRLDGVADIDRLADMDCAASGLERAPLLRRIAERGEVLLAENGFALMRDFGRGRVIGPVVAQDDATARALIAEGARRAAGAFLRIDLPQSRGLGDFVAALGLAHAGGGTAMSLCPGADVGRGFTTYALASQALG